MSDSISYEEEALGKAYDSRLLVLLWPFISPYRWQVLATLLMGRADVPCGNCSSLDHQVGSGLCLYSQFVYGRRVDPDRLGAEPALWVFDHPLAGIGLSRDRSFFPWPCSSSIWC